jgi:apolipoprotein N-acyltransferase
LWPTNSLLGINAMLVEDQDRYRLYNAALLLRPGDEAPTASYYKIHRVPFGEYVPLRDALPFMNYFAPYEFDYSIQPGRRFTRFPLGAHHFGVLICFEDTDPPLARRYVVEDEEGPAVDFLINISNDGWFVGSAEHDEHLAICRFRAVECRRAVARAVNMGISALIDGNGAIVALPAETWRSSKKSAGVVVAPVPLDTRQSLYATLGDWLPWTCWLMLLLGMVAPKRNWA